MCENTQISMQEFLKLFSFKSFLHHLFQSSDCELGRRLVNLVMLSIDFLFIYILNSLPVCHKTQNTLDIQIPKRVILIVAPPIVSNANRQVY